MKNRTLFSIIILFLFACNEKQNISVSTESEFEALQPAIERIKKLEYSSIKDLRVEVKLFLQNNQSEVAQLIGDYYLAKANFLEYHTEEETIEPLLDIYKKLKEHSLSKLMAEIDILLIHYYYIVKDYDKISKYIKNTFEYCFKPELYLERNVLILGLSPSELLTTPELRVQEISNFLKGIDENEWSFYLSIIYLNKARNQFLLKDYNEARKTLEYAIKRNEENGILYAQMINYYELGLIYKEEKEIDCAIEAFKNAIDQGHKFETLNLSRYYRRLGHLYFNLEKFTDAVKSYENTIKYGCESCETGADYAYLGWAHFRINKEKNYEKAQVYFDQAISMSEEFSTSQIMALERKLWTSILAKKHEKARVLKEKLFKAKNLLLKKEIDASFKKIKTNAMLTLKSRSEHTKLLEYQNKLQEERILRQQYFKGFSTIILISFLGLLYNYYKKIRALQLIKQKEQELKKTNLALESSNLKLEYSNKSLNTANKSLENFAFTAAHDIKAPLWTINSFSKLIEKKYSDTIKEDEFFSYIRSSAKTLGQLVDDLLVFSRLDKNLAPPVEVNLNEVIRDVEISLDQSIKSNNVKIISTIAPVLINAHTSLMYQVFLNTISNSIKFRSPAITPIVKIDFEIDAKSDLIVKITDNGLGIEQECLKKIFHPFTKGHSSATYEGSGIGLASCKKVLEQYEGDIWAKSIVGQGTSMFFKIPSHRIIPIN